MSSKSSSSKLSTRIKVEDDEEYNDDSDNEQQQKKSTMHDDGNNNTHSSKHSSKSTRTTISSKSSSSSSESVSGWHHFSREEMQALIGGVEKHGKKWATIVQDKQFHALLKHRHPRSLEKRWRYHVTRG